MAQIVFEISWFEHFDKLSAKNQFINTTTTK